jgi:hypothetical protein
MSKTKGLRKVIWEQLQTVPGGTYHRKAPNDARYPYKTFRLESVSFADARDDLYLEVDIWDRNAADDPKAAEDLADQVETLFRCANIPQPPLYPTFFRENRYNVEDPDKTLQHIQLHFLVQLYEEE